MSISLVSVISDRIKSAREDSPIAVFTTRSGLYDAMVAGTAYADKRIREGGKDFVGVFYGSLGVSGLLMAIWGY